LSSVYAESSAVLRWLLGSDGAATIQPALAEARAVVTSALTSAEVARTLHRLRAGNAIDARALDSAWARYSAAAAHWHFYAVSDSVLARVSQAFPREPVRTLDAIHLATAALFSREVTLAAVLSFDARIRENAQGLGLTVMPPDL